MRAFALVLVAGCSAQNIARFTGKAEPRLASAAELEVFQGHDIPHGYKVIGVVTTTCDTYNGASGLFEARCNDETLLDQAKKKAAEVGGSALIEPSCSDHLVERILERKDGGGAVQNKRSRLTCQASVGRPLSGVIAPKVEPPPAPSGESVTISGAEVVFHGEPEAGSPLHEPRPIEEVGELERVPEGYPRLGRVTAECRQSCSSSTARRGLKHAAAKLGAIGVAESSCEPAGERWKCQGIAIGDAIRDDLLDAGAPG